MRLGHALRGLGALGVSFVSEVEAEERLDSVGVEAFDLDRGLVLPIPFRFLGIWFVVVLVKKRLSPSMPRCDPARTLLPAK
jgi:hypothetical protein